HFTKWGCRLAVDFVLVHFSSIAQFSFNFDELCISLLIQRALSLHSMRALVAVVKLPWISGVVLLNVFDRFVNETKSNLSRNRKAFRILCTYAKSSFFLWLVLFTIGVDCDVEKPFHRRDHNLFLSCKGLSIANHQRAEIDVGNVLLLDRQFDQFCVSGHMDQTVTEQVFTFDTKQHIPIGLRHRDHHGGSLSGAERVFVDDEIETFMVIAEISRGIGADEDVSLGFNRRQQAIAHHIGALAALPRDVIVAFALGCEIQLGHTVFISLNRLRAYLVLLITAKLQSPPTLTFLSQGRKHIRTFAQLAQLFALHFTPARI